MGRGEGFRPRPKPSNHKLTRQDAAAGVLCCREVMYLEVRGAEDPGQERTLTTSMDPSTLVNSSTICKPVKTLNEP